MLRHHLVFALRNFWKNKFHALINILGLAIGVSACLVIYLIVNFELSFNTSIPDYDRIYRIHSKFSGPFSGLNSGAPTAVAPYVKDNFKGVEEVSMFFTATYNVTVPSKSESKKIASSSKTGILGPEYFKLFPIYHWLAGSPDVLTKPNQVVLTESQAKKYFGTSTPDSVIGRQLIYRDSLETTVAGILSDLKIRTDLEFTDFISSQTIESTWLKSNFSLDDWESTNSSTQIFVKAQIGTSENQLREQLPQLSKIYNSKNDWAKNDFNVQPFSALHFDAETGIFDFSRSPAHLGTIYILAAVALMLLVIGAINFINLETAQAVRRAKEIGVRKVLGSTRLSLMAQFIFESVILTLISLLLAIPLAELGLQYFSEFVPNNVSLTVREFIPFLLLVVMVIGLLASSYPAFVLSSYRPALALKNQAFISRTESRTAFLRKFLIVFQFTFAQVLIVGTLMVGWQVRYLLNRDLGFRKDAVIYFHSPWQERNEKKLVFKTEIEKIPEISELTMSDQPPSYHGWSSQSIKFNDGKSEQKINVFRKFGDTAYIPFYGITLLAGRNLWPSDTVRELIINETLRKQLGFASPQSAINQVIDMNYKNKKVQIIGVVKDFNFQSLHHKIEPVIMANAEENFTCFNIRLAAKNREGDELKASLDKIEKAWKKVYADIPFEYHFLDETIRNFYNTEQRTSKLSRAATSMAILISCLGLFGLASYTSVQRTKEIGIRKVMGATAQQIVYLLSKDFLLLVLVGFIIASPIAWYAIDKWLSGFIFRAGISMWVFAATVFITLAVAFATVSYQTFKAANADPVDSLRNE